MSVANTLNMVSRIMIDALKSNDGDKKGSLPILIRMHPPIRRDLPLLRQLDHMHRRRMAALPA
jgi:hypothetical protein